MTTQHTPGPWRTHNAGMICGADNNLVASCHNVNGMGYRNAFEIAANARFIAAAPELLEALVEAEKWLGALLDAMPCGNTAATRELKEQVQKRAKAAGVTKIATEARKANRAALAKATGAA